MTAPLTAYTGARIFDGHDLLTGHALVVHPDGIPRITPLTGASSPPGLWICK